MSHPERRSRKRTSTSSVHHARPALEGLEERLLLYATLGANWVYGSRITYSFVPDGTSVGGPTSTLFQSLNARYPQSTWQREFQEAAAVWQAVANINLVQVADNGMAFGAYGSQQGDARVGDIRIGAIVMGSSTLGAAFLPPQINGGTLAGDIVLNSTTSWMIDANYDLKTVAIHEFGHALGMSHSQISTAVMYSYYMGMKQGLATDDVNGIRSIYSARAYDAWNSNGQSNAVYWNAKSLDGWRNGLNQITVPNLNITTPGQTEWFWVTIPAGHTGSFQVQMQSSGLSLLTPQVTVYDASLGYKGSTAGSSFGDTVTVTISGVSTGQGFFIRLSGTGGGTTGSFGLQVDFGGSGFTPLPAPYTVVASQVGTGGGFMTMSRNDHDDMIQIGDLTALGHALTTADVTGTEPLDLHKADEPPPDLWWIYGDRLDVSAWWRGRLTGAICVLDDAFSTWSSGDDEGAAFGGTFRSRRG